MTGRPKGAVALTPVERNRAYRERQQRAQRETQRKLADAAEALQKIAFEARTLTDARAWAREVLTHVG